MLTDRANRRLEAYLAKVRHHCDPRDAGEVVAALRADVMERAGGEAVDADALDTILEQLGEPESFADGDLASERRARLAHRVVSLAGTLMALLPVFLFPLILAGQAQRGGLWEGLAGAEDYGGFALSPQLGLLAGATCVITTLAMLALVRLVPAADRAISARTLGWTGAALSALLLAISAVALLI